MVLPKECGSQERVVCVVHFVQLQNTKLYQHTGGLSVYTLPITFKESVFKSSQP